MTAIITQPSVVTFELNSRLINADSVGEVKAFAALRIESLRAAPRFLDGSVDVESDRDFDAWQEVCRPSDKRAAIGLFVDNANLVGITYCKQVDVKKWGGDESRKTAESCGTYINKKFRSREATNTISRAIRTWIRENAFDDLVAYIYPNNLQSIAACTKRGAVRIHDANTLYADGKMARAHLYKFDLRASDLAF